MALDLQISAETFDGLNEGVKAEYKKDGDGYKLDVRGIEDTGALKRAKDRETTEKNQYKARVAELETELGDTKQALVGKDTEWQGKLTEATAAANAKIDKLTGHVRKTTVDDVAFKMASEISTSPKLLAPHIASRLQADFEGDAPVTKILDASGQVSKISLDDLKKEFVDNKDFSAIIKGSGASGGGAGSQARQNSGSAQFNGGNGGDVKNLANMSPKELAAYRAERKAAQE